jgi:hypothetical protein
MAKAKKTTSTPRNAPVHIAWIIPDREEAPWIRAGATWRHQDGKGLTLQLDAMPITGRIVLRDYEPKATNEEVGA